MGGGAGEGGGVEVSVATKLLSLSENEGTYLMDVTKVAAVEHCQSSLSGEDIKSNSKQTSLYS